MKRLIIFILTCTVLLSSCSIFKKVTKANTYEDTKIKTDVEVKKEEASTNVSTQTNKQEDINTIATEEITYRKSKDGSPDEIVIKKTYAQNIKRRGSSKVDSSAKTLKLDSVDKSKFKEKIKTKDSVSEPTPMGLWTIVLISALVLAAIIGGLILHKKGLL